MAQSMSRPRSLSVVKAKKSAGKAPKRRVKHVIVTRNYDVTFSSETHYHPETKDEKQQPYNMEPFRGSHADQAEMADHMGSMDYGNGAAPESEDEPANDHDADDKE